MSDVKTGRIYPGVGWKVVRRDPIVEFVPELPWSLTAAHLGSPLIIDKGFGGVIAAGWLSCIQLWWAQIKFRRARAQYKHKAPTTYVISHDPINCYYRAYQICSEAHSNFLFVLMIGGLHAPKCAAFFGFIYVLGRYVYATEYYSGDIRRRANGGFHMGGTVVLWALTFTFAARRGLLVFSALRDYTSSMTKNIYIKPPPRIL